MRRDRPLGVDADDIHDIAEKMVRLLEDASLRGELSRRALARSAGFRWETTAAATLQVYSEVIAQAPIRGQAAE